MRMKMFMTAILMSIACLAPSSLAAQTVKERENAMTEDEAFATSWVNGWNQRDLEAVLSHYADDVEFQSPLAAKLLSEPTGTVRGKQNLRDYFGKALAAFPGDLQIVLLGTYRGVNGRVVHFEAKGRKAVEVMELNSSGKIRRAMTFGQP
jgi:ketosteroid isomerase-like protein